MTAFNFDARNVEPDQGRVGALPKGWYKTVVSKTKLKPTGNGTGQAISVTFQVVEGAHKGAVFFNNFNVQNPSEKAVEIGHKQFSALLHAVNVLVMQDTDQIKGIPFFTRLKVTPAEMEPDGSGGMKVKYDEKNEPTAYRNINDQAAIEAIAKQGSGAAPQTPAAAMIPPQQMNPAAGVAPVQGAWGGVQQQPPMQPMQPIQQPAPQQYQQQAPMQQQPQYQQPPVQQPAQQAPMQSGAPAGWQPPAQPQPWAADPNAAPVQQAPQQGYQPQQQPVQEVQYQQVQQQPQQQAYVDPNAPPPWQQPQQ